MQLNEVKEGALLSWINSVYPEEPFTKIIQMMDGHRLLKFAYRVQGKDLCDGLLVSPFSNVMEMIFSMLQADFHFSSRQASLMLQNISEGVELELQLAKVVLVLCYCGFKTYNMMPLDVKTGLMIASMFHFVEDDADGLSLDKGIDGFLTKASVMTFSTSSSENSCCSPLYNDDESPIFSRVQNPPRERFTVTCASVSSPHTLSTPQLLKRLQKVLAHEGDVRDELEKELANQISLNSKKEGMISQLQHRVERMLQEQGELEKDYKAALLKLQEKNERVHEVVKQCQDLKTENTQIKKMIDVLTKENLTFAAQALTKTESVQTQMLDLSKQISLKDEEITNLSNKYNTVNHELKLVKEQNIELKEVMKSKCQKHEDTVKKLQQELDSASLIASKKQEEMLVLSTEVTSLTEQICCYSENEAHKQKELSVLETQHNVLKEKFTSLQNQLAEVKESELKRELCHQTMLKEKAQKLERAVKEHHTEISALALERDAQISYLEAEMKNQQLRSERLQAHLELKVDKQNGSIIALKNMARQWKQQNEELLEKLKITLTQLQHYTGKNKQAQEMNTSLVNSLQASRREVEDLQMERDQAKAKVKRLEARVDFAERRLQEWRNMSDDAEEVRCGGTEQDTSNNSFSSELNDSFNANAHVVGVEDKPEHAADDWMRIAELQARNKACLPHLKSSYPLESRPTVGLPSFSLTDEDLRMGDPKDTIHRAALCLHESQHSHTLRQPGSLLHDLNTPEQQYIGTDDAKMFASCVSRTVTLKSKHSNTPSNAEPKRRRSVMFTIVNTPKHQRGSLLQRGLRQHEGTYKSPAVGSRVLRPVSAANGRSPLSLRKSPRNKSTKKGELQQ